MSGRVHEAAGVGTAVRPGAVLFDGDRPGAQGDRLALGLVKGVGSPQSPRIGNGGITSRSSIATSTEVSETSVSRNAQSECV
ncbi:hypothetical protein [Streptomyces sp. NPDC055055]